MHYNAAALALAKGKRPPALKARDDETIAKDADSSEPIDGENPAIALFAQSRRSRGLHNVALIAFFYF